MYQLNDCYASMPWDEIDNVVFDVGNVLLTLKSDEAAAHLFPQEPEMSVRLMECLRDSPYWCMLDRGAITEADAARVMAKGDAAVEKALTCLMQGADAFKRPVEEGVRAARACKAHGKRLYILSNYDSDSFARMEEKHDFFRLFDGMVVSARVHLMKPEPSIYHYLLDTYGLNAARTLFIDDMPYNVESALNVGLQAVCFRKPGTLDAFIR